MAYTVRTEPDDETHIDNAKKALGEKSAAAAMIRACKVLPENQKRIETLERELQQINFQYHTLLNNLKKQQEATAAIADIVSNTEVSRTALNRW